MTGYTILLCGGMGFLLGVVYEGFRLLRTLLRPPKAVVFGLDVLYGLLAAPPTFLFLLVATDGRPRAAALTGLAVGFFACRATVGRLVTPLVGRLLHNSTRWFRRLWDKAVKFTKTFFKKHLKPTGRV